MRISWCRQYHLGLGVIVSSLQLDLLKEHKRFRVIEEPYKSRIDSSNNVPIAQTRAKMAESRHGLPRHALSPLIYKSQTRAHTVPSKLWHRYLCGNSADGL